MSDMGRLQSRKWLLTINNPNNWGITENGIKEALSDFKSIVYYCYAKEVGVLEETPHYHIFCCFSSAVRFTTIKNKFPTAHLDICKGTCSDNKAYVFKEGAKWRDLEKSDTKHHDIKSHYEYGEMPVERQGARNDLQDLLDMIVEGKSDYDILQSNANYLLQLDKIEKVRQAMTSELYKRKWRELEVTYISGLPGVGKTRYVMESVGFDKVYRVTDYSHPFDNYKGQDVLLFDEFRSSLTITDMLNYLDGYPLELPSRYTNKVACYTKVYLISNIPLEKQYTNVQINEPITFSAFCRRINKVYAMDLNGLNEIPIEKVMRNVQRIVSRSGFLDDTFDDDISVGFVQDRQKG